jgi:hypothetical protein
VPFFVFFEVLSVGFLMSDLFFAPFENFAVFSRFFRMVLKLCLSLMPQGFFGFVRCVFSRFLAKAIGRGVPSRRHSVGSVRFRRSGTPLASPSVYSTVLLHGMNPNPWLFGSTAITGDRRGLRAYHGFHLPSRVFRGI